MDTKSMTVTTTTLTTEQFADVLGGKPSAIRTRLCKTGSYYGLQPIKLPSGRLLWLVADINNFLESHRKA